MLLEQLFTLGAFLTGCRDRDLARLQVRVEGDLRVDRDVFTSWEVHDHVGTPGTGIRGDAGLQREVDSLDEPGGLNHVAQLSLAPDATRAVALERGCQCLSSAPQAFLGLGCRLQLLRELAVLQAALGL